MFVDITEEGSRSGAEITELGAKVFCEHGAVAGDQRMTASRRAEVVWTNDVKGPEVYTGAPVSVALWMLPGGASLGNNQLFPRV